MTENGANNNSGIGKTERTEHEWWGSGVALMLLFFVFVLGACGTASGEVASETAVADAPVAEVEEEATTTTTTAAPETAADSATEAPAEEVAAIDVEPNFELIGELELTTGEINDMVAFVEQSAGREFARPPVIEIVSVEEFEAGLHPHDDLAAHIEEGEEPTARFHQALGDTTLSADELAAELATLGTSTELISGRYDPADDTIYIPDGVLTGDDFNAILVHEMLHALDDQYVDLGALIERLEDLAIEEVASDSAFQIAAVVEGRATATQFEWMMANNVIPGEQEIPESFSRVPVWIINSVTLPYQLGARSIFEQGGVAATWDLYENFPESSEQMIFPSRIGTDTPTTVEPPVVDGEVFIEGTMGVEGILLLGLGNNLEPSQIEVLTVLAAAEGWGGDYFVLTGNETESCVTGSIVADTEADLAELADLFTEWANRETVHIAERSATVDGETLTVSSCAPFIS